MKKYEIMLDDKMIEKLNQLKRKHIYKPDTWTTEEWLFELMLQGYSKLQEEYINVK